MHERLILPPFYKKTDKPIIFLAGPITGAPDWQSTAINYIIDNSNEIFIASPRRMTTEYKTIGFTHEMFNEQVDWETFFLNKSASNGAIIFWLAKEAEIHPERAYAQTTRFELAEWITKYKFKKFNIFIGMEDGFTGAKYIRRRLMQDFPELTIFDSIEELLYNAVAKLEK